MKVRLIMYTLRKEYLICALEREVMLLSNKARYIGENLEEQLTFVVKRKMLSIKCLLTKSMTSLMMTRITNIL